MAYEIEFHPVGDASRAGDAITVRYGEPGNYRILVIDGGTDDSGTTLVEHIAHYFGPDSVIDHVISTHPDTDHACGLRKVLETYRVHNVWLHGIWHHAEELLPYFADKRWTGPGLADAIKRQYPVIAELIALADAQSTPVREPFQGQVIGPFTVLSPSRWSYLRLLPQFRRTPESDKDALSAEDMLLGASAVRQAGLLGAIAEHLRQWADEQWNVETLREGAVTAAENESSVVLYGDFGSDAVLLTADSGVNGLLWSCAYAERNGLALDKAKLVQVPHHGSRSNVTPCVLDKLLGPVLPFGSAPKRTAVVSAPINDERHPRKVVINAFRRRGAPVFATQGQRLRYYSNDMLPRADEAPVQPMAFFDKVEAYD